MKLENSGQSFGRMLKYSHENLSSGSWVFMCQQTADQHDKPDSQFSQICKSA